MDPVLLCGRWSYDAAQHLLDHQSRLDVDVNGISNPDQGFALEVIAGGSLHIVDIQFSVWGARHCNTGLQGLTKYGSSDCGCDDTMARSDRSGTCNPNNPSNNCTLTLPRCRSFAWYS